MTRVHYLTLEEYARRLQVPHGTVRRWAHEGMPVRRLEPVVRVPIARADAWVAEHHRESVSFARESTVYFARSTDGLIKIGFSSDLERRPIDLRKSGHVARVVAAIPGDKRLELALHERFAELRHELEWFRDEGALASFVQVLEHSRFAREAA